MVEIIRIYIHNVFATYILNTTNTYTNTYSLKYLLKRS